MKRFSRVRLGLEQLENRLCPSVSANVTGSLLTVSGAATNPGDAIFIKETGTNQFEVDDGATPVGGSDTTPFMATSIKIKLTSADDIVQVDLQTRTLGGNLTAYLGNGTNSLTVQNGTISGRLNVTGGDQTDTVDLASLTVSMDASINLGGGSDDVLAIVGSTFSANLTTYYVNNITLDAASKVVKSFTIWGGYAGNTVAVDGSVGVNLSFLNPFFFGNQIQPDSLTLGNTAQVGRDLTYISAYYDHFGSDLTLDAGSSVGRNVNYYGTNQADTIDIAGNITGSLYLNMGRGDDSVTVASSAVIGVRASVYFGKGNNTLDFGGTVGPSGGTGTALIVSAGGGSNIVTLEASTVVNGSARILFGAGADLLDVRDSAKITGKLTANGGGNAQTKFRGSVQPNHTTLLITGFPIVDGSANP
jgi:hypothetical protein